MRHHYWKQAEEKIMKDYHANLNEKNQEKSLREMEDKKQIEPPQSYKNLPEDQQKKIEELIGEVECTNPHLEELLVKETNLTVEDIDEFIKWWFHGFTSNHRRKENEEEESVNLHKQIDEMQRVQNYVT